MIGLYQEASMVLITFDAAFVWGPTRTKLVLFTRRDAECTWMQ